MGGTVRVVTIALLSVSLLACRVPLVDLVLPKPPSDQERASFGKVALITARGNPPLDLPHAIIGWPWGLGLGLVIGVTSAVLVTVVGTLWGAAASGGFLPAMLITIPLGFAAGALTGAALLIAYPIIGVVSAESADPVAAAMTSIPAAMAEMDLHRLLRDAMVRAAAEEGRVLTPLDRDADDPDPRGAFAGFDTVLEVRLLGVWDGAPSMSAFYPFFAPFTYRNPLHVAAQARLLRRDGRPFYGAVLTYRSPRRALKMSEWGANGARALREESRTAVEELGRSIVDEAFFTREGR